VDFGEGPMGVNPVVNPNAERWSGGNKSCSGSLIFISMGLTLTVGFGLLVDCCLRSLVEDILKRESGDLQDQINTRPSNITSGTFLQFASFQYAPTNPPTL
jgi:hypothetical protein